MDDTSLRRLLDRIADLTVVGLLTLAGSVGVVTALAALTAAATVLAGAGSGAGSGSLPARYLAAFRRNLRSTLRPQLAVLAALGLGLVDVAVGLHWLGEQPSWLAAPAIACGSLLIGAALTLPPYLAVLPQLVDGPTSLRQAAGLACARPVTTVLVPGTGAVLAVVGLALPVLTPLLIGVHVLISVTAVRRAGRCLAAGPAARSGTRRPGRRRAEAHVPAT